MRFSALKHFTIFSVTDTFRPWSFPAFLCVKLRLSASTGVTYFPAHSTRFEFQVFSLALSFLVARLICWHRFLPRFVPAVHFRALFRDILICGQSVFAAGFVFFRARYMCRVIQRFLVIIDRNSILYYCVSFGQVFKYISFNKTMTQLSATLNNVC